jgi:hypothetical protein
MMPREEKRKECCSSMRLYIPRHLFGIGTAAVVGVVLCWGWPVYHGVAQASDEPADATLTVRQCIGANATIDPLEETLVKEDVIEENLLQTKVTNGICEDMLAPISDGTSMQKLLTAQNYMQEINLIERSMREAAADEAATRGPDWHSSSDETLILFRTIAQTDGIGGVGSPSPSPLDESPPPPAEGASPPAAALLSTFAAAHPCPSPDESPPPDGTGGGGGGTAGGSPPPTGGGDGTGGHGTGGGDGIGGVEPSKRQAAAAASGGEDDDAAIAERLRQKEAALKKEGASATQAAAGARCSLEVDTLDEKVDKIKGMYQIRPLVPEKMQQGETEDAGLVVSPVTKERFGEITQQHRDIAEASKSYIGCVRLTDRMKATLSPWHREELDVDRNHPDDIRGLSSNRAATWNWDVAARQAGKLELHLVLRYTISRKNQEFRLLPQSPIYEGAIRATPPESDSTQKYTERAWWQRLFGGLSEWISKLFGA